MFDLEIWFYPIPEPFPVIFISCCLSTTDLALTASVLPFSVLIETAVVALLKHYPYFLTF